MDATHQKNTMHFSLLQGSIQGAFLFIPYASSITEIILHSLQPNGYVDDHSLRKSFKPGIIHEPTKNANIDVKMCTTAIIEDSVLRLKPRWTQYASNSIN